MSADIDIDFADREQVLKLINHRTASQYTNGQLRKHNSGIYVTEVPWDALLQTSTIDYQEAESRGYFKIDLLNVSVYQSIENYQHYQQLLDQEPNWSKLADQNFVSQLIHIGNHYDTLKKMPEPVNSITRMAMFLAVIRPGKRHLIGLSWNELSKEIWEKTDQAYTFKKAHAVGYAHLVALHMNLIDLANQSD